MKNSSPLGKVLKKYRESCGFTQQQVANALNVDRSTYTYYETGNTTPNIHVIMKLATIFNVPYQTLIMSIMGKESQPTVSRGFRADSYDSMWVMNDITYPRSGYIDPYESALSSHRGESLEKIYDITNEERQLLAFFRVLTSEGKRELLEKAGELNRTKKS